jgi:hypothetical protein
MFMAENRLAENERQGRLEVAGTPASAINMRSFDEAL